MDKWEGEQAPLSRPQCLSPSPVPQSRSLAGLDREQHGPSVGAGRPYCREGRVRLRELLQRRLYPAITKDAALTLRNFNRITKGRRGWTWVGEDEDEGLYGREGAESLMSIDTQEAYFASPQLRQSFKLLALLQMCMRSQRVVRDGEHHERGPTTGSSGMDIRSRSRSLLTPNPPRIQLQRPRLRMYDRFFCPYAPRA